ncbi:MAG: hypothetical protein JO019_02230 [Candidatus Kaiserbacteria bacterium]|nr:hypothetical protein [Candidatus Kaiserbacteria bacterium]
MALERFDKKPVFSADKPTDQSEKPEDKIAAIERRVAQIRDAHQAEIVGKYIAALREKAPNDEQFAQLIADYQAGLVRATLHQGGAGNDAMASVRSWAEEDVRALYRALYGTPVPAGLAATKLIAEFRRQRVNVRAREKAAVRRATKPKVAPPDPHGPLIAGPAPDWSFLGSAPAEALSERVINDALMRVSEIYRSGQSAMVSSAISRAVLAMAPGESRDAEREEMAKQVARKFLTVACPIIGMPAPKDPSWRGSVDRFFTQSISDETLAKLFEIAAKGEPIEM